MTISLKKDIELDMEDLDLSCRECGDGLDDEDELVCASCFANAQDKIDELEEKIGGLEGDLSDKQDEVDKLEKDISDLETEVARLNEELSKAKSIDDILGVLDHYDMKDKASQMPEVRGDDQPIVIREIGG